MEEYELNHEFWNEWFCRDSISYRRNHDMEINYKIRNEYD